MLLERAALNCRSVILEPPPRARAKGFGASSIEYDVQFFVERFESAAQTKSDVLEFIYRHAKWSKISLVAPQAGEEPVLRLSADGRGPATQELVDRAALFAPLPPAERKVVEAALVRRDVSAGRVLITQGSADQSAFVIEGGVFSLLRNGEDGASVEIDRRGPGEDFGAVAVLSGKPWSVSVRALTSGVVYELRRSDVAPQLAARPELKAELDLILAKRTAAVRDGAKAQPSITDAEGGLSARLFERVVSFLNSKNEQ